MLPRLPCRRRSPRALPGGKDWPAGRVPRMGGSSTERRIEGRACMVEARFNGRVIARSRDTVLVEGNHYFPMQAVSQQYLTASRSKSLCPWKGIASYYTVEVDGQRDRNAAWTYRHPFPLARKIKDHVAFWGSVHIEDTD